MQPKVSVIIPVYNVEKYLRECLDSVINQTLKDLEIICVDDGSTDSSLDILNEYADNDSRIRVLRQKNQYAGVARNNGMDMANGEYLYFMDSDDFCDLSMLEKMYLRGTQYDADIILCSFKLFEDSQIVDIPSSLESKTLYGIDVFNKYSFRDDLYQIIFTHPWDKMFKNKFLQETGIRFQGIKTNNDVFFVLMNVALANRIVYVSERLYFYRKDSVGSLQKSKHTTPLSFIMAYEAVYDELNKRGLYDWLEKTYINRTIVGIDYNFRTISDEDARMKVRKNLVCHFFPYTHLLEYDKSYYKYGQKYENVCSIGAEYYEILSQNKLGENYHREIELKKSHKKIEELEKQLLTLKESLESLKREKELLDDIRTGTSFRIGRIITWLPRKLLGRK